jgi:2-keto-4-pentenoate hydratase/2-oxohepta-3-ene-1,7-dioic acid hydratase in catechol pathway
LGPVRLLAPVQPTKIVTVGRNYPEHAAEMGHAAAEQPRIFFKPPSAVVGPGEPLVLPPASVSTEVHHEAELAVIMSHQCRNATAKDALSFVLGLHLRQ